MIDANFAYVLGLFQTDGHRRSGPTRSPKYAGHLSIELNNKDVDVLHKLQTILGPKAVLSTRERVTNFSGNKIATSSTIAIGAQHFPPEILQYIPLGKKSLIIKPPEEPYSECDYWRGIIDGDGSLGFRKTYNKEYAPYLNLTTASEELYLSYKEFIRKNIGYTINQRRNKRDRIYNITLGYAKCIPLVKTLYYTGCVSMERKLEIAQKIINWKSPTVL